MRRKFKFKSPVIAKYLKSPAIEDLPTPLRTRAASLASLRSESIELANLLHGLSSFEYVYELPYAVLKLIETVATQLALEAEDKDSQFEEVIKLYCNAEEIELILDLGSTFPSDQFGEDVEVLLDRILEPYRNSVWEFYTAINLH